MCLPLFMSIKDAWSDPLRISSNGQLKRVGSRIRWNNYCFAKLGGYDNG